ncbi:MAG: ATP-binding cassette domain-containing protein [Bacteroidetes bacterium]|nr:ATP-binding cassette domain-containing protein [Bacteroidota bacterium]
MKPILEIQSISKKFRINHEQQPYLSLRDSLSNIFKNKHSKEDFWALKEVSFDVMPGDTVGIIGKNGAGKSTLLKILSKITPPTSGKIISRGRIASLLEVGTGFHPELSGRENIFMNGSILGMRRAEIQKNFEAIVDFAGVEKFIDTPLKHYSSGMQLRLAFAVAAFLENEILIIDEVLAVGDAEFQKKCMGKMGEVSKSGRTILFVSHSMPSLQAICKKGLVLTKGETSGIISVNEAVSLYLNDNNKNSAFFKHNNVNPYIKDAYIIEAKALTSLGNNVNSYNVYEDIIFEIIWENKKGIPVTPNFTMVNQFSQNVMIATDTPVDFDGKKKTETGIYKNTFKINKHLLNSGQFHVHLALNNALSSVCYDLQPYALNFSVVDKMDELSIQRGAFRLVREDAVLWPVLDCNFEKIQL